MSPRVSIIILNWNGWRDTIECLESLYQITYPNYDVILVDNGSEDESVEKIKEYSEGKIMVESKFFKYNPSNKPIKIIEYTREEAEAGGGKESEISDLPSNRKLVLIKNEKNYGFAEGNNIGIRYALKALNPDYTLLLNNDAVVDKEFLGELVVTIQRDTNIGIVGPKIFYYHTPSVIWFAGGKINWYTLNIWHIGRNKRDSIKFNKMIRVDWVSGCAMLIKKELFKLKFLDPLFFFGHEDIDFCVSLNKHYKILYEPKAIIWHKVSKSREKFFINRRTDLFGIRNHIYFLRKHSSTPQYVIRIFLYLIKTFSWYIFTIITKPKYSLSFLIRRRNKRNIKNY